MMTKIILSAIFLLTSIFQIAEAGDVFEMQTGLKIDEKNLVWHQVEVSKNKSGDRFVTIRFGKLNRTNGAIDRKKLGDVFFSMNFAGERVYSWKFKGGWLILRENKTDNVTRVRCLRGEGSVKAPG